MDLARVQQQNRPCRKDVIASPAIGAHGSPVDGTDRRHSMKVPGKLIVLVGTVK